jgi:heme exporter protein A
VTVDFERLTVDGVSCHFGRRRALTRVSFGCAAGEIAGLLGGNGAGKSTLLGVIATVLPAASGQVQYGAWTAATGGAALRGRLGLLAHDPQLYPELSARENLEFFGRLYGLRGAPALAAAALDRAGLASRGDDPVESYSRGMRQRLALERTLLHGPRLVLLDEPFTGLDDASTGALLRRLAALRAEGAIVLLATHDLDLVDGLLDRAFLLREGRLADVGEPGATLRDRYRQALTR